MTIRFRALLLALAALAACAAAAASARLLAGCIDQERLGVACSSATLLA
jgi:hypothetical protein